tara:strand:- start:7 stop:567 length:561 start_codon:yes stop_codon:yes gene_type:complete
MATEAHYEFMNAVYKDLKDKKHTHGVRPNGTDMWIHQPNKEKALTQVRARLFTIQLDLRPELPLPQELVDKIYHEALMSEFMEKLPKHKNKHRLILNPRSPKYTQQHTHLYSPPKVWDFWIGLCVQLKKTRKARLIYTDRQPKPGGGWTWTGGGEVNKKAYLIEVLTNNGVKCDKSWTVKRLVKAL